MLKVKLPWNATVCDAWVSVIVKVAALTVLANVVPFELVSVIVPISVPTAPLTLMTPVVFNVKFDTVPLAVPVTAPKLIAFAIPVPTVNVTLSANVASAKVMVPVEPPPTVAFAVTAIAVLPKLMALVPLAAIVPAIDLLLGAVAVTPPVNVSVSDASFPKVTVPVLVKVTAFVIVPPALIATL